MIRGLLGGWNVSSEFFFFFFKTGGNRNILAWTSFRVETINILKTIKIVPDKTYTKCGICTPIATIQ